MSKQNEAFSKQLAAERDFYLGKSENIPGSDKTLKVVREEFEKASEAFQRTKEARRQAVLEGRGTGEQTSVVVPGVVVTTNLPTAEEQLPALPSDEELDAMEVKDLITLAGNRKTEVKANVDSKAVLIAKLKGIHVSKADAKEVSLTGKTRGELETIAGHFGIKGDDKEAYPNIETLTEAIETARKPASKEAPAEETETPEKP